MFKHGFKTPSTYIIGQYIIAEHFKNGHLSLLFNKIKTKNNVVSPKLLEIRTFIDMNWCEIDKLSRYVV